MMCQKMFPAVFTALILTSVVIEALELGLEGITNLPDDRNNDNRQISVLGICEGTEKTLRCQIGTIQVSSAIYGRTNTNVCPRPGLMSNVNCKLEQTAKIAALCNGKRECLVKSSNVYAGKDPCFGTYKYTNVAYTCLVDGNWGAWSTFGPCSKTCGGGTQSHTRLCNSPAPSNGGRTCPGSSSENKNCNTQSCPKVSPPPLPVSVVGICEGNNANLHCQSGFIQVSSAIYGRTNTKTCPKPGLMSNTNCKLDQTVKIAALCNGKSDCWVKSSNEYAGNDPCFGTYKYTDVTYTCLEAQTVVDACGEQNTINLKCTTGSIKVDSAFYGRMSYNICPMQPMLTNNCKLDLTSKIATLCNGKSDCQITSSVGFAGKDPCGGTQKYTEVTHRCI